MYYKDITNKRFGKLTALKRIGRKNKKTYWLCQCDCGKIVFVTTADLTRGRKSHCGCDFKLINNIINQKQSLFKWMLNEEIINNDDFELLQKIYAMFDLNAMVYDSTKIVNKKYDKNELSKFLNNYDFIFV